MKFEIELNTQTALALQNDIAGNMHTPASKVTDIVDLWADGDLVSRQEAIENFECDECAEKETTIEELKSTIAAHEDRIKDLEKELPENLPAEDARVLAKAARENQEAFERQLEISEHLRKERDDLATALAQARAKTDTVPTEPQYTPRTPANSALVCSTIGVLATAYKVKRREIVSIYGQDFARKDLIDAVKFFKSETITFHLPTDKSMPLMLDAGGGRRVLLSPFKKDE